MLFFKFTILFSLLLCSHRWPLLVGSLCSVFRWAKCSCNVDALCVISLAPLPLKLNKFPSILMVIVYLALCTAMGMMRGMEVIDTGSLLRISTKCHLFCLTLQVLQSRTSPASVPWKGGAVSIFTMTLLHLKFFYSRERRVVSLNPLQIEDNILVHEVMKRCAL